MIFFLIVIQFNKSNLIKTFTVIIYNIIQMLSLSGLMNEIKTRQKERETLMKSNMRSILKQRIENNNKSHGLEEKKQLIKQKQFNAMMNKRDEMEKLYRTQNLKKLIEGNKKSYGLEEKKQLIKERQFNARKNIKP